MVSPALPFVNRDFEKISRRAARFFAAFPTGFSNCIIIAPMGGGTSCGATKKIVEFALKNNITVTVITSMPFKKEGILRIRRSTETLTYLKNLCKVIEIKIEPIDFYETLNLNIVFNIMDSKFIEVIKKL